MFKHKRDEKLFLHLHPLILMVMFDMKYYCEKNDLPFLVTSTLSSIEEDEELGRMTSSHRTGRAFDLAVRSNEWKSKDIAEFKEYFEEKFSDIAAFSKTTLRPALVVYGDKEHRDHMHIQINKRFSKNPPVRLSRF